MKIALCGHYGRNLAATCTVVATILCALLSFAGENFSQNQTTTTGVASYYGAKYHGKRTASGEVFDMYQLTAAHPSYKFGTRVKVSHLANNRSVIVRINDRGPFIAGRAIDLSQAAAEELQMIKAGLAEVKMEIVE